MQGQLKSVSFTWTALIAISCYCFIFTGYWKFWKNNETPFISDTAISYWYVPATFIHHDYKIYHDRNNTVFPDSQGRLIPKYTYGMSLMYTPFFFIGHKMAIKNHEILDGYSPSYGLAIHYGCLLYGLLGLLFIGLVLRRYFSDKITAFTILLLFFASNLFIYVIKDCERVHCSLFFLYSIFLWITIKWHEQPNVIRSVAVGFITGLITMIRPTDFLIIIVFVLYSVNSLNGLKNKINLYLNYKFFLVLSFIGFIAVVIPQLIFWKVYTNEWWHYTYGNEGFFWTNPKLFKMLFSFRNGWFIYTPLMLFAFAGLFLVKKYAADFFAGNLAFVLVNLYVLSCWWCWWYMGFGLRAVVQSYPIMAFGLAAFLTTINEANFKFNLFLKYSLIALFCFFTFTNLVKADHLRNWLLSGDGETKKLFFKTLCKTSWNDADIKEARDNFPKINLEAAIKGER